MNNFIFKPFESDKVILVQTPKELEAIFLMVDNAQQKPYDLYNDFRLVEPKEKGSKIMGTFVPPMKKLTSEKYPMWDEQIFKMYNSLSRNIIEFSKKTVVDAHNDIFSMEMNDDQKYEMFGPVMIHEFIRLYLETYVIIYRSISSEELNTNVDKASKELKNFNRIRSMFQWIIIVNEENKWGQSPTKSSLRNTPSPQSLGNYPKSPQILSQDTRKQNVKIQRNVHSIGYSTQNPSETFLNERLIQYQDIQEENQSHKLSIKPAYMFLSIKAHARYTFDESGNPLIEILRDPVLIENTYKKCDIHSGFHRMASVKSLNKNSELLSYCGYLTENGTCYDNCHSAQIIPIENNELTIIMIKAKAYEGITSDFMVSIGDLIKLIDTMNDKKTKCKNKIDECNKINNAIIEYVSNVNRIGDITNFLGKFFIPIKKTIGKKSTNEKAEHKINLIDNTIYSSFFNNEDKINSKIFVEKTKLYYSFVNDDMINFEGTRLDIDGISNIVELLKTTTDESSEIYKFSVNFDEDTGFEVQFNFTKINIPNNLHDALTKAYNGEDLYVVFHIKKTETREKKKQNEKSIVSYNSNCYKLGYNILSDINCFETVLDNIYFRTYKTCRNLGHAFLYKFNVMNDIFTDGSSKQIFINYKFTLSNNIVVDEGNFMKIVNAGGKDIHIYIPRDIYKPNVIQNIDDKYTILGVFVPICKENIPFVEKILSIDEQRDEKFKSFYCLDEKLSTFILRCLISDFELIVDGEHININSLFDSYNPIYSKKTEKSHRNFLDDTNRIKMDEIVENVLMIDSDTCLAKYKMINNETMFFDNMFVSCRDDEDKLQKLNPSNYYNNIKTSEDIINSKLDAVQLLHDVDQQIVSEFLKCETPYDEFDFSGNNVNNKFIMCFTNSIYISDLGDTRYNEDKVFNDVPFYYYKSTDVLELGSFISDELKQKISPDALRYLPKIEYPQLATNDLILRYFTEIMPFGSNKNIVELIYFIPSCAEIMSFALTSSNSTQSKNMKYCQLDAMMKFVDLYKKDNILPNNKWLVYPKQFLMEELEDERHDVIRELQHEPEFHGLTSREDWINVFIQNLRTLINENTVPMFDAVLNLNYNIINPYVQRRNSMVKTIRKILTSIEVTRNIVDGVLVKEKIFHENDLKTINKLSTSILIKINSYQNNPTHDFSNNVSEEQVLSLNKRLVVLNNLIKFLIVRDHTDITFVKNIVSFYIYENDIDLFARMYDGSYDGKYKKYKKYVSFANKYKSVTDEYITPISDRMNYLDGKKETIKTLYSRKILLDSEVENSKGTIIDSEENISSKQIIVRDTYIKMTCMMHVMFHFYDNVKLNNIQIQNVILDLKKNLDQINNRLNSVKLFGVTIIKLFSDFIVDMYKIKITKTNTFIDQGYDIQSTDNIFRTSITRMNEFLSSFTTSVDPELIIKNKITELDDSVPHESVIKDFYKLFLSKIESIQNKTRTKTLKSINFEHTKISPMFLNPLNSHNKSQFESYTVDTETHKEFEIAQNNIENFIVQVMKAMAIIDNGPGFNFISKFCMLLHKLKLGSENEDEIIDSLNAIKLRIKPFKVDKSLRDINFDNFVTVLNGEFFGLYKNFVKENIIEPLPTYERVTSEYVKKLIIFITSDSDDYDGFIESYSSELLFDLSTVFNNYTDEYVCKSTSDNNYVTLNDSLVLELRANYVLKSEGQCYRPLFKLFSKHLDTIRRNYSESFYSNIYSVYMNYVSGILHTFTGRTDIERYMNERNV